MMQSKTVTSCTALCCAVAACLAGGAGAAPHDPVTALRPSLDLQLGARDRVSSIVFSPDGRTIAATGLDGAIRLWDPLTGQERVSSGDSQANFAVFSPDGRDLATCGGDSQIWLRDPATTVLRQVLNGHSEAIRALAFSGNGSMIASASMDKTVRLWTYPAGSSWTLTGHDGFVGCIAFSPDNKLVASGSNDSTVRLWDVRTRALVRTMESPLHRLPPDDRLTDEVRSLCFSHDGATLATANQRGGVRLWETATGRLKQDLPGPLETTFSVAYSRQGDLLASVGADPRGRRVLDLWDTRAQKRRYRITAPQMEQVAFSPDGSMVATGGEDALVRLYSCGTGRLVRILGRVCSVFSLAVSPDGRTLASGSRDGAVRQWNLRTGALTRVLTGHPHHPMGAAFSPDGRRLVSFSHDSEVLIWDLATDHAAPLDVNDWIFAARFLPHSNILALCQNSGESAWDISSGVAQKRWHQWSSGALGAAFSPDGRVMATGHDDRVVQLRDARTGAWQATLWGCLGAANAVTYSPDGRRLIAGSGDGTIRILDAVTHRCLVTLYSLPNNEPGEARQAGTDQYLAVTPEGYYGGSAAADRVVRFNLEGSQFPAECFQARYYRPDLLRQALAGQVLPPVGAFHGPYPPLVAFLSLESGAQIEGDTVPVVLEARDDSEIRHIELFVTGSRVQARPIQVRARPIQVRARPVELAAFTDPAADNPVYRVARTFTLEVPLPVGASQIKLQAVAYDDDGLQSPRAEVILQRAATPRPAGRLLGLCVGISHYQDSRLDLKYSDRDATALAASLNLQGLHTDIYRHTEVAALTNEAATRPAVMVALERLAQNATRADTVVLFLSGHGWRDHEGRFYFAPHDVSRADLPGTAIPWSALLGLLQRLSERSGRVVVLLDACHSGSAATHDELVNAISRANAGVVVFTSGRGAN